MVHWLRSIGSPRLATALPHQSARTATSHRAQG